MQRRRRSAEMKLLGERHERVQMTDSELQRSGHRDLPTNPVMISVGNDRREPGVPVIVPAGSLHRLIDASDEYSRLLFELTAETSARLSEVLGLV
jgi:hypothetical protein